MGLFDRFRRKHPELESPEIEEKQFPFGGDDGFGLQLASFSPLLVDEVRLYGIGPVSYSAIYRRQPSVYTVTEFLAWQISQIGLKVYQRASATDRPELNDSPIAQLLRNPAPGLTYERFLHRTVADICVFGNAYWLKLERGGERILVPVPVLNVTPVGGTFLQAETYRVNLNGQNTEFPNDEVVHFRRYNPDDPRIGVSPLEPLRRILAEEAASGQYREGLWKNAARREGIIQRPGDAPAWADTERRRFREDWQNAYAGGANSGKTVVLEDGMTFNPDSFSPKEAEFIEGRRLTLETVARAFNVPVSVLGLTETATFASQREFHKALYQDTLGPWLKMLEAEIQLGVVPWFTNDPTIYVEFNLAEKLKGSFEEQAAVLSTAVGGPWMVRNEARARQNLPRIDDPSADELITPLNVTVGGQPAPNIVVAGEASEEIETKDEGAKVIELEAKARALGDSS